MVRGQLRTCLRRLHLVLALAIGGIVVVSGLTGCALVWFHELDRCLNPGLFAAVRGNPLSPADIEGVVERLSGDPRYGRPTLLSLPEEPGEVAIAWYRAAPSGKESAFALARSRQVMIDPATLNVTGERIWGEIGLSRPLLMPTLFHLHRFLLAGERGRKLVAIAGLGLVTLCAVGLVLWWPKAGMAAWRAALSIAVRGSWAGLNYRAHRAVGAILAPVLMMMGFSGTLFNEPDWIVPAVALVAPMAPQEKLARPGAAEHALLSVAQAVTRARQAFPAARISRVSLPAKPGLPFDIRARQPGERRQGDGNTRLSVDAVTGAILRVRDPLHALPGDAFLDWQFPLHTGEAFGGPGRCFMTLVGLAPLGFMLSGLAIWLRRRR